MTARASAGTQRVHIATFLIADNLYGVPTHAVEQLISARPLAPVPLAPKQLAGLINVRGRVVSSICLRTFFGLSAVDVPEEQVFLILRTGTGLVCLIVDKMSDVVTVEERKIQRTPDKTSALINGTVSTNAGLVLLLDPQKVQGL